MMLGLDYLQSIGKRLVEPGQLRGNAEVDCAATNLDNESADNVRVDLARLASGIFLKTCFFFFFFLLRTVVTTLSFLPWLYSDLAMAFSRRETVLLSSSYQIIEYLASQTTHQKKKKSLPEHW